MDCNVWCYKQIFTSKKGIYFSAGLFSGILISYLLIKTSLVYKSEPVIKHFTKRQPLDSSKNCSIVFVGGHPRSGTTLMRVLLDAHPNFNCGQETHIIPNLLSLRRKYSQERHLKRITQAGVDLDTINNIIADSILTILKHRHSTSQTTSTGQTSLTSQTSSTSQTRSTASTEATSQTSSKDETGSKSLFASVEPTGQAGISRSTGSVSSGDSCHTGSTRFCTKDPFTLKHIPYLSQMFPNAQFILMVRDVRAVVHSIRENKVKIAHFPNTDKEGLKRWSRSMDIMYSGCLLVGSKKCMIVYYESLVTRPRFWLEKILSFLIADWNEAVLKHTQYFNISGGILLSSLEKSTNQVQHSIHQRSLYSWLSSSSLNVLQEELINLAPMMKTLGYTDIGQPPNYLILKGNP